MLLMRTRSFRSAISAARSHWVHSPPSAVRLLTNCVRDVWGTVEQGLEPLEVVLGRLGRGKRGAAVGLHVDEPAGLFVNGARVHDEIVGHDDFYARSRPPCRTTVPRPSRGSQSPGTGGGEGPGTGQGRGGPSRARPEAPRPSGNPLPSRPIVRLLRAEKANLVRVAEMAAQRDRPAPGGTRKKVETEGGTST